MIDDSGISTWAVIMVHGYIVVELILCFGF